MAKKKGGVHQGAHAARAIRKTAVKVPQRQAPQMEKSEVRKSLQNNTGSFLKDRQNKKVKDLRCANKLGSLHEDAEERAEDYQRAKNDEVVKDGFEMAAAVNPNMEAENTRRRFYGELRKVIASADVVIQVLDARDPGSCRSMQLEKDVLSAGKKLVLLLNKIDLVPKHAVVAWREHLQRSFPVVTFKAARSGTHRPTHANTSAENAPEGLLRSTHNVVGADELMQLLKNYARMSGGKVKAHTTVGIVGYPNTGKSSIINSMKRHNSVPVGGRAGVTTVAQEVPLDSKVTLIDSPGVVFSGNSEDPAVVLRNVIRVENIADPIGVVEALINKTPRESLLEYYGNDHDFETPGQFLIHVAQSRGKMLRGSGLDIPSAARSVIQDWTSGRFRYFVMPPVLAEGSVKDLEAESANVVTTLAPALDLEAMMDSGSEDEEDMGAESSRPAVLGAPVQRAGDGDDGMDCEEGGGMVQVDM